MGEVSGDKVQKALKHPDKDMYWFAKSGQLVGPKIHSYFVTDIKKTETIEEVNNSAFVMYRTQDVWQNVLMWMVLCSLNAKCIAPTDEADCLNKDREACQAYDQTLMTFLLANWKNYDLQNIIPKNHGFKAEKTITVYNDLLYCYSWKPSENERTLYGKPIHISHKLWSSLQFDSFVDVSDMKSDDLVFVLASSENHFAESVDAVASVQAKYPNKKIIYYDIEENGMKPPTVQQVRYFNFIINSLVLFQFNLSIFVSRCRVGTRTLPMQPALHAPYRARHVAFALGD